jgi:predicted O-methyltransferase YrrM
MLIYGRNFELRHFARAASVFTQAMSPLFLRAMAKGPETAYLFAAQAREGYDELVGEDPIPATTVSELEGNSPGAVEVWLDLSRPTPTMSVGELAYLCALVKLSKPRTLVEIGTERGLTTLHFSRNTGEECRIFTVDLPPEAAANAAFYSDSQLVRASATIQRVYGDDPKITQILKDSNTIEWGDFLEAPIDFAFIDASHLYEHVRKDTEGVLKALSPNGLVVWHDYRTVEIRRGVRRYLTELHRGGLPVRRIEGTTLCLYARDFGARSAGTGMLAASAALPSVGS